ncbi:hypothetical protein FVE85_6284 [Porphyridium purpureum]|uniref:Uncharacterized protein n=1 Tax=Porphyridium purpureum TaxID=35688 RepID=A0A5J4Z3Z2_PORPP|nr:hypothetical protein FVE85_6284 [Porphyridium purpureum]|eukprot:POR3543..scf295_1
MSVQSTKLVDIVWSLEAHGYPNTECSKGVTPWTGLSQFGGAMIDPRCCDVIGVGARGLDNVLFEIKFPRYTCDCSPAPLPSPTPTAFLTPDPTETPATTHANLLESTPTPTHARIGAGLVAVHALDKVDASAGVGHLPRIARLDDLPCGTHDHALEVSDNAGITHVRLPSSRQRKYSHACVHCANVSNERDASTMCCMSTRPSSQARMATVSRPYRTAIRCGAASRTDQWELRKNCSRLMPLGC